MSADGGAERGQGRQQRQGHGEQRPEDEEQDDGGQQDAEPGAAERLAVGLLGDLAGHRHLEVSGPGR